MHKHYIHFWYRCKSEILIHREILNCYETLLELNNSMFNSACMQRLTYVLERLMSIETFCDNVNPNSKTDNKLKEFKQYKFDETTHDLITFNDNELRITYNEFINKYKIFIEELNNSTRADVESIIKCMHEGIGLNIPKDVWHGIKIKENPDRYYWKANESKKPDRKNNIQCIRYLTNVLKHCYEFESMIETNGNALGYSRVALHNICKNTIDTIENNFDIRPIDT